MTSADGISLDLGTLRQAFEAGLRPTELVDELLTRLDEYDDDAVWIHRVPDAALREAAARLEAAGPGALPLYGIPFAVKDNINVAGLPTTAACPDFSYVAEASAPAVQRLLDAGAILVGKTNLDQFATGLVGVRSPYGACRNTFDPDYVSGGSSSGSAVAVAAGLVSFSLGTDTAGSGRVPAGFNNIVGVKPTCGIVSTNGVVPACRTLDCVSVFALTAEDGAAVLDVFAEYDADDPYSRRRAEPQAVHAAADLSGVRLGVPRADQLAFFGNAAYERAFADACDRALGLGAEVMEIDFAPFAAVAVLLYEGPWVAERYVALKDFMESSPDSVFPVTRKIVENGRNYSAADTYAAMYRLAELKRASEPVWDDIDALLMPTAGAIYSIAEVEADPVQLNTNLGYYTNFVNLLDLSGIAVPSAITEEGLPFGVTLIAPAFRDRWLGGVGGVLHRAAGLPLGATGHRAPAASPAPNGHDAGEGMLIAVNGAHMRDLPLNHQLTDLGATFVREDRTADVYRLYALSGLSPLRPGLVRADGGASVSLEIWSLPTEAVGRFLAQIPPPLGLGRIELAGGDTVVGFLCEQAATESADDITGFGGWRDFLAATEGAAV